MEGKRFFEGNRTLVTSENVEKPILNGLRMLARLGDTRLAVEASHRRDVLVAGAADTEVDALAALGGQRLAVLVWHQADTWWAEGEADVELTVAGAPFAARRASATGASTAATRTRTASGSGWAGRRIPRRRRWRGSRAARDSSYWSPPGSSRPRRARSCSASRSPSTRPRCWRSSRPLTLPPSPESAHHALPDRAGLVFRS